MPRCVSLLASLTFLRAVFMIKTGSSYIALKLPHLRADGETLLAPCLISIFPRVRALSGHHLFPDRAQHEFRPVCFLLFQQAVYYRDDLF